MCRVCESHEETYTLHILCFKNSNMHVHRQEIINDLQLAMLGMTNGYLTPLYLLEWLFQEDEIP